MTEMEQPSSNLEHLDGAVRVLVGVGPVKQRLAEASTRHLAAVDPDDLPRDLAGTFSALMSTLNTAPAVGGLSSIEATIRKMSEQDAARHALRAFDLCVALAGREFREAVPAVSPRQLRLVGEE